jgi:hypothetical protein
MTKNPANGPANQAPTFFRNPQVAAQIVWKNFVFVAISTITAIRATTARTIHVTGDTATADGHNVIRSNRILLKLESEDGEEAGYAEKVVVRAQNMHTTLRLASRVMQEFYRGGMLGGRRINWDDTWQSLQLDGSEFVDVIPDPQLRPQSDAQVVIIRKDGSRHEITVTLRIDTAIEVQYYRHGGILPFVLRQLLAA